MRIGELELGAYFFDEKEYISLNAFIDRIKILTACTNQFSSTKELSKEPVKRILRWYIEEKEEYAAPKNVQFGKWEPVRESSASTPSIVTSSAAPKTALQDTNTTIERKVLKEKNISKLSISWKNLVNNSSIRVKY